MVVSVIYALRTKPNLGAIQEQLILNKEAISPATISKDFYTKILVDIVK